MSIQTLHEQISRLYDTPQPYGSITEPPFDSYAPVQIPESVLRSPPNEPELDAFAELQDVEQSASPTQLAMLDYAHASRPPLVASDHMTDHTDTLLATLPQELGILRSTLDRLEDAIEERKAMRDDRLTRLRRETGQLHAKLGSFANIPTSDAATQIELRRTHLEKLLDTAKDRIDMEDRASERDLLMLETQKDQGVREYLMMKQLTDMIES